MISKEGKIPVRYIIIRGPLGVGKTTVSKLLAKKIEATVIDFDKIMIDLEID